jgi:hypothetical protein
VRNQNGEQFSRSHAINPYQDERANNATMFEVREIMTLPRSKTDLSCAFMLMARFPKKAIPRLGPTGEAESEFGPFVASQLYQHF